MVVAPRVGEIVGNYRLIALIGEGGFGEVYLAENPLIGRRAAVKLLHPELARADDLVRRFLNEARAASAIQHSSIVQVFDAGVTPEGAPYLLMEFLEGQSLQKSLADSGPFALPRSLAIASQAGAALSAAHDVGIVHRDLKPENLFLVPDKRAPGGELVKILDFGIAKIRGGTASGGTLRTQTGMIMGSPAYMSPEQCKDSADVDHRADIYSLATILYEMLAGRTPYIAASGTELLIMHLTETPPPLQELAKDVPAQVAAVIMRGLARERSDRFDSMADFISVLRDEPPATTAKPPGVPEIVSTGESVSTVRPERTLARSASTTFSRSTGEIDAKSSDHALLAAARPRRWIAFAAGGATLMGVALFLHMRPSHHPAYQAATSSAATKSATPPAPAAPVAPPVVIIPESVEHVAPAMPSIKTDAGAAPPAAVARPAAKKRRRAVARKRDAVPSTNQGRSEEEWLAH